VEVRKSLSERLRRIEGPVTSRQGNGRERSRTAEPSDTCHKTFTTRSGLWTVGRQGTRLKVDIHDASWWAKSGPHLRYCSNAFCFGLLIYKSAPANGLLPRHNPVHVIRQTPRKPPSTVVTQSNDYHSWIRHSWIRHAHILAAPLSPMYLYWTEASQR
jgi:hypothetical protein